MFGEGASGALGEAGSGGTNWQTGQHFNYGQDSTFAGTETAGNNADANGYGDYTAQVTNLYLSSTHLINIGINTTGNF